MHRACPRAMRRALFLAAIALGTGVAIACSSSVPGPSYVAQPTSALHSVPYPPPPARVETVPKQPRDEAVWIDGEWVWQARRWAWRSGRWLVPPANAKFSPWTTARDKGGTLYVANGVWRNANGEEMPEPPVLASARKGGASAVVSPEGDEVTVGGPASSANATSSSTQDAEAVRATNELDASGPPTLESEASPPEQILDAGMRD